MLLQKSLKEYTKEGSKGVLKEESVRSGKSITFHGDFFHPREKIKCHKVSLPSKKSKWTSKEDGFFFINGCRLIGVKHKINTKKTTNYTGVSKL